jgi:hypothetical protein
VRAGSKPPILSQREGAHLLPLVRAGIAFMHGVQQEGKVNRTKAKAA